MAYLNNKSIGLLGFGVENQSLLHWLLKQETGNITVLDFNSKIKKIKNKKISWQVGENYLKGLNYFDIIFRSPGISLKLPQLQKAIKKGVELNSATKLFFKLCPASIIGVSGTKGKGTTSLLLYNILKRAGRKVWLAGNIGRPVFNILNFVKPQDLIILELSSFQLMDLNRSPQIVILLDITPDHLDYHLSFKEYWQSKAKLVKFQTKKDWLVVYKAPLTEKIARLSKAKKLFFNQQTAKKIGFVSSVNPAIATENIAAAALVSKLMGVPRTTIIQALKQFKNQPYRLQLIKDKRGIKIFNDSASTNPVSIIKALELINEPKILIVGGLDKGFSYLGLAKAVVSCNVRKIIILGANKNKIMKAFKPHHLIYEIAGNLNFAFKRALKYAKKGETILFSPGAASFDQFKNYKERGEMFNRIVKKLF